MKLETFYAALLDVYPFVWLRFLLPTGAFLVFGPCEPIFVRAAWVYNWFVISRDSERGDTSTSPGEVPAFQLVRMTCFLQRSVLTTADRCSPASTDTASTACPYVSGSCHVICESSRATSREIKRTAQVREWAD